MAGVARATLDAAEPREPPAAGCLPSELNRQQTRAAFRSRSFVSRLTGYTYTRNASPFQGWGEQHGRTFQVGADQA